MGTEGLEGSPPRLPPPLAPGPQDLGPTEHLSVPKSVAERIPVFVDPVDPVFHRLEVSLILAGRAPLARSL